MDYKFSVVMAVYNVEQFLGTAGILEKLGGWDPEKVQALKNMKITVDIPGKVC